MAIALAFALALAAQDGFEGCDGENRDNSACIQTSGDKGSIIADVWSREVVPHVQETSEKLRKHQNPVWR